MVAGVFVTVCAGVVVFVSDWGVSFAWGVIFDSWGVIFNSWGVVLVSWGLAFVSWGAVSVSIGCGVGFVAVFPGQKRIEVLVRVTKNFQDQKQLADINLYAKTTLLKILLVLRTGCCREICCGVFRFCGVFREFFCSNCWSF